MYSSRVVCIVRRPPKCYDPLSSCFRCVSMFGAVEKEGHSRTQEHANMIIEEFGLDVAWRDYGIAGKCIVSRTAFPLSVSTDKIGSRSWPSFVLQTLSLCPRPISYISSSKAFSRTTLCNGWNHTSSLHMAGSLPTKFWMTLIVGMCFSQSSHSLLIVNTSALPSPLLSQDSGVSLKATISNSGQVMIPKH